MPIADKFINNRESGLLQRHEQFLDELWLLYHIHPTKIVDFHPTDREFGEIADGLGWTKEEARKTFNSVRTSTKVDHHSNPYYSNGLKRRSPLGGYYGNDNHEELNAESQAFVRRVLDLQRLGYSAAETYGMMSKMYSDSDGQTTLIGAINRIYNGDHHVGFYGYKETGGGCAGIARLIIVMIAVFGTLALCLYVVGSIFF